MPYQFFIVFLLYPKKVIFSLRILVRPRKWKKIIVEPKYVFTPNIFISIVLFPFVLGAHTIPTDTMGVENYHVLELAGEASFDF